ncbi:class I glutamine amidotransferase-like protein [Rhizopogon vinicolor AM-OR11-026]|uniref:D-lactate dehydratase n=1 Tax=Rhizopogon vinicolor AM-OR11-026 TaxID=1314800 RepID=A0A1B7N456_9AGAM|nr:class I glutamine amidotransferase-like protein [Rhizopogon vinicolor AM-OR11-026]
MVKALILITDGTEEMDTIAYDTLVRAGIDCTSAFVPKGLSPYGSSDTSPALAVCSRQVKILPDVTLDPLDAGPDKYDVLIIPGGMGGAVTMAGSTEVQNLVGAYYNHPEKRIIGMICAGILFILVDRIRGLWSICLQGSKVAITAKLPGQPITSHPSVQSEFPDYFDYKEQSVVVSDAVAGKATLVTSRGPGTAFPFAFTLVELLCGKAKRDEVVGPMIFPTGIGYPF